MSPRTTWITAGASGPKTDKDVPLYVLEELRFETLRFTFFFSVGISMRILAGTVDQ